MAWRYALVFAAGLATALIGVWLLIPAPLPAPPPPTSMPEPVPRVAPDAVPVAGADAPPATAPATLADIQRLASDFAQTAALYRLASGLDVAGVERLLDEARGIDQASERAAATSILYARYADLDPAAALRHIQGRGAGAERWLGTVFHAWARSDLDAALSHFETLSAGQRAIAGAAILNARDDLPQEERVALASRLAPQGAFQGIGIGTLFATDIDPLDDPADAWQQAQAQPAGQARMAALYQLAFRWAETDPQAALDAILATDNVNRQMRNGMNMSVVSRWAQDEPAKALAWVMEQPASRSRDQMISSALHAWAGHAPRAAAAWLDAQTNEAVRRSAVPAVAAAYAASYPDEAIDWLSTLTAEEAVSSTQAIFSTLSRMDPERASRLLRRVTDADAHAVAANTLVHGWASLDPEAAMEWLDRQPDTELREALYPALLQQWADYDAAGAIDQLDRLTDPTIHDGTVINILQSALYAHYDVALAESLFNHLRTDDARRSAASMLYEHLSETDPARAARYR